MSSIGANVRRQTLFVTHTHRQILMPHSGGMRPSLAARLGCPCVHVGKGWQRHRLASGRLSCACFTCTDSHSQARLPIDRRRTWWRSSALDLWLRDIQAFATSTWACGHCRLRSLKPTRPLRMLSSLPRPYSLMSYLHYLVCYLGATGVSSRLGAHRGNSFGSSSLVGCHHGRRSWAVVRGVVCSSFAFVYRRRDA